MSVDTTVEGDESREEAGTERIQLALLWVFPRVQSHVLDVGKGPWRVGRAADCTVPVDGRRASREHAEIAFDGPVVLVRDLQSTNGTFVDGVRIEQAPVKAGSILRIGSQVGVFCKAPASSNSDTWFRELVPGHYAGPTLQRVLAPITSIAMSDLPVVIIGDTGTGKERVADFIHRQSGRSGPFHAINCGAIPSELAESQLFGHIQGAFTGAKQANIGHFRAAHGGTLFLDEVAELPLAVQAKLLRVLEERSVISLGDTKPTPMDVRVVAATQRALAELIQARLFRADLAARLSGFTLQLPPLSERIEEVPFLFLRFIAQHSRAKAPRVEAMLIERLCLHSWPGNIRELELLARQLLASHANDGALRRAHLPKSIWTRSQATDEAAPDVRRRELERLARALRDAHGNVTRASESLGISRARAYRLIDGQPVSKLISKYLGGVSDA
jgi:sigma-54 dependent transcriptional regulator, acetoin dehydrogenase operon transcriptional activator AcoR